MDEKTKKKISQTMKNLQKRLESDIEFNSIIKQSKERIDKRLNDLKNKGGEN